MSGELYEVSQTQLLAIDQYENSPFLYERELITLETGTQAYTFILRQEFLGEAPLIQSGSWRARPKSAGGQR